MAGSIPSASLAVTEKKGASNVVMSCSRKKPCVVVTWTRPKRKARVSGADYTVEADQLHLLFPYDPDPGGGVRRRSTLTVVRGRGPIGPYTSSPRVRPETRPRQQGGQMHQQWRSVRKTEPLWATLIWERGSVYKKSLSDSCQIDVYTRELMRWVLGNRTDWRCEAMHVSCFRAFLVPCAFVDVFYKAMETWVGPLGVRNAAPPMPPS